MGLSSAIRHKIKHLRFWERARVLLMSWRNDSAALLEQHRRPIAQDKVQSEDMITDAEDGGPRVCGTRRELCHPDWCHTSTMTVTILTLYSGSELVSQSTTRTEFYYVIKGEGLYVKGDAAANPSELSLTLSPGDCFVVDPFCTRGFKATGRGISYCCAPPTESMQPTNRILYESFRIQSLRHRTCSLLDCRKSRRWSHPTTILQNR